MLNFYGIAGTFANFIVLVTMTYFAKEAGLLPDLTMQEILFFSAALCPTDTTAGLSVVEYRK